MRPVMLTRPFEKRSKRNRDEQCQEQQFEQRPKPDREISQQAGEQNFANRCPSDSEFDLARHQTQLSNIYSPFSAVERSIFNAGRRSNVEPLSCEKSSPARRHLSTSFPHFTQRQAWLCPVRVL